jgi:hypothetical protein
MGRRSVSSHLDEVSIVKVFSQLVFILILSQFLRFLLLVVSFRLQLVNVDQRLLSSNPLIL